MALLDEKLIAEIKARPTLYDTKLAEYGQMDKRRALWEEVAEAVGEDIDTCRKKWRSLRYAFLKRYRAVKDCPNDTATKKKRMWPYYSSLFFLAPYVEMDETVNDVAVKYIETAEQISCSSNDTTEQPESDVPIVIESIFSVSPEETTNIPETSPCDSDLDDSSDDEKYSNLLDAQPGGNDYIEAPNKPKQPDEAYKNFLLSLEHAKNTELSVENFISEIKARPLLYAKGYIIRKHPKRLALWKEVAHATSLDVMSCKKRWRSLRDVFNKNYRALINFPADKKKKMWPYFEKLFFLAPHLEAKETFQHAITKYRHLCHNEKQEPNLLDDTTNTVPLESGDSPENIKEFVKDESTSQEPNLLDSTTNTIPLESRDSSKNIKEFVKDEGTSDEAYCNFIFYDPAKLVLSAKKSEKTHVLSEEKLIAAVKARPPLYTRGTRGPSQRNKRLKLWNEVASVVGEDVLTCKRRWRSLRDVFIRNHRAVTSLSKYEALEKKKRWIHYKKLFFLLPYLGLQDTINDATIKWNQLASDHTSKELNTNGQIASTSAFLLPLHNTGEMLPQSDNTWKQPELSVIKTENSSTFLNDIPEQTKPEIQSHKLRSCLVSLRRIPVNVPLLLGGTSETLQSQKKLDDAKIFPDPFRNQTENSSTLSKEQTELQSHIDNVNPETIKNIVFEKSQSQLESVNSPVNEIVKPCSPVNKNPDNLNSTDSRGIRGPYKRSIKRKLCDLTEEELLKILSHDDDPDKNFLLSLLPSLKRMTSRQNALARIKLQQVLFDVEFSEQGKNVSDQLHPQSFVQATYSTSSPSGSFYASDMSCTD